MSNLTQEIEMADIIAVYNINYSHWYWIINIDTQNDIVWVIYFGNDKIISYKNFDIIWWDDDWWDDDWWDDYILIDWEKIKLNEFIRTDI